MSECNVSNRTIFYHDNLDVLRGINSECIDLIYLDPPFAKNDTFVGTSKKIKEIKTWYLEIQKDSETLFSGVDFEEVFQDTSRFKDIWNETDIQREHYSQIDNYNHELITYFDSVRKSAGAGTFYYLIFMSVRLIEMHRVLKETGGLYLHCDTKASHYLKIILDKIFGSNNFRNEIIWKCTPAKNDRSKKRFSNCINNILYYTKTDNYLFQAPTTELSSKHIEENYKLEDERGRFMTAPLYCATSLGGYGNQKIFVFDGLEKRWMYSKDTLSKLKQDNRIYHTKKGGMRRKVYLHESKGTPVNNLWNDIDFVQGKEKTGYPTQKPLALLNRIIETSSNEGDVVLDPFCGCATTCIAANNLGRHWIGIDWNVQAYYMVYWRAYQAGIATAGQQDIFRSNLKLISTPPNRTDKIETIPFYEVKSRAELKKTKRSTIDPQYKREAIDLLYEEQAGICNGCDAYMRKVDLTIDHIIPIDAQGTHDIDNLQLLCYRCNNWKRVGTMVDLIQTLYDRNTITIGTAKKQMVRYGGKLQEVLHET